MGTGIPKRLKRRAPDRGLQPASAPKLGKSVPALRFGSLTVRVFPTPDQLAQAAAAEVSRILAAALSKQRFAAVILATGNSQIRFLELLAGTGGIDWSRVTLFHMDEYLGLSASHPASFRRYMRERVETRFKPRAFHYLDGDCAQPILECERYERLLRAQPIDLCCLGIGENGHLAFNDPPVADFKEKRWVKIVKLDDACKRQQVGEGHFSSLASVPAYAITLTIPALLSAKRLLCLVPESRKAIAVRNTLLGPISVTCPASILRRQPHATLLLDKASGALL